VQEALTETTSAKGEAVARCTELDQKLEKTIRSLDAATAEKELTKATLSDTKKDLEKEKKAGAALGEQVIDLSKQVEELTARADKSEGVCKQLEKGASSTAICMPN
jgi:chromosome segregation ATPase